MKFEFIYVDGLFPKHIQNMKCLLLGTGKSKLKLYKVRLDDD